MSWRTALTSSLCGACSVGASASGMRLRAAPWRCSRGIRGDERAVERQAARRRRRLCSASTQSARNGVVWPLFVLGVGIIIVLGLIIGMKVNAFLALITAAMVVSLLAEGIWPTRSPVWRWRLANRRGRSAL